LGVEDSLSQYLVDLARHARAEDDILHRGSLYFNVSGGLGQCHDWQHDVCETDWGFKTVQRILSRAQIAQELPCIA
jgi:hypothetical protein